MLIEALKPLTVKLPAGDLQLKPGCPVNLTEDWALKLLAKAPGKVRMVEPHALAFQPGDLIHWQAMDGKTYGPALVEQISHCAGRTWAWVTWDGVERALSEILITAVEPVERRHKPQSGPSLAQRPLSSTTEADKATTAKAFGSLAFTCSGCGQAVTQLHKAGDHWQCSHCAGVDAIALLPVAAPLNPCRLCATDSWWRSGPAEVWLCRRCHPPASLPVYEVLGPYGKPGDAVRTQPRADAMAWEAAWRELGPITDGITEDDSRVPPIMVAVEQCNTARLAGDWPAFHQAVAQVRLAVQMEDER